MDGVLVIDKPSGPTSHDIVVHVRRALKVARAGHTGTLDPIATGVLPLVLGRATRLAQFLAGGPKSYEADFRLGLSTDTYDTTGTRDDTPARRSPGEVRPDEIESALQGFRGTYLQPPPVFSAKKIGGVPAHRLARRKVPVQPSPALVSVSELAVIRLADDVVSVRLTCSPGYYVRSLAHGLGERLGTGAVLERLRRLSSGQFTLAEAWPLDAITGDPGLAAERLIPMERLLISLPGLTLTEAGARRVRHGHLVETVDLAAGPCVPTERVRLLDADGALLAIAEPGTRPGTLRPAVVLV